MWDSRPENVINVMSDKKYYVNSQVLPQSYRFLFRA